MQTHSARYAVLVGELARSGSVPIGVLLEDPQTDTLHLRLRRDWDDIADEEEAEVFALIEDDLAARAREAGAAEVLGWFLDHASHHIHVEDARTAMVEDFSRALNRLYHRHVAATVQPFRTHLPVYSLRAAAGRFLENAEISEEEWVETPAGVRLSDDMFIAHIAGRSMEPKIPDGAMCIFRGYRGGSRENLLVLARDRRASGFDAYSVKRYHSEKRQASEAEGEGWVHSRIWLESLNPEYPSWDLDQDPDRYAILAEFVGVLE